MIDKNYGDFDVYCDFCSYENNFDTDGDFYMLIAEMKELGWKIFKREGSWTHKCPICVEEKVDRLTTPQCYVTPLSRKRYDLFLRQPNVPYQYAPTRYYQQSHKLGRGRPVPIHLLSY